MKPSDRLRLYWKLKKQLEQEYGVNNKDADELSYLFLDMEYDLIDQGYLPGGIEPKEVFKNDQWRTNTLAHFRVAKSIGIGE